MSPLQELNDYLNRHVPLFRAMQAQIERCDATGLALTAHRWNPMLMTRAPRLADRWPRLRR